MPEQSGVVSSQLAKPQAAAQANLQVASSIQIEDADPVDTWGRPKIADSGNGKETAISSGVAGAVCRGR
ncbi:MAG: hypothetical protein DWB56_07165 [Candidatus Jettenia sp.]|uniref:hypothetical protein n=1 Tax=Candidatus Jettenia sp. AMX1 TaxID=2293637 RepID=UPI00058E28ED|nr:hypothetical protein [Candidatus Jettenia sp. AMX1]MBC6928729.1 hypothetical protein [Candidatus Jettenia sp.]NUN22230.1 hypothetical protein [Candidatus Jettenia caeni]KAA0250701.1 MAG: hypothetical protein EDM77_04100 [Candidatus Jettenia sp. AMX1]MCE7880041.1 hypothetical protein [Candidatus Jettenia sp. AMX1]MCQ3926822.1 hypothetical protein [Candidatus Jettenia sp.]